MFRCFSGKIRKAIEDTDLIELIAEYVGRENPVIKRCSRVVEMPSLLILAEYQLIELRMRFSLLIELTVEFKC